MSRQRKHHYRNLPGLLKRYAEARKFEIRKINEWQYRIIDKGYTKIDIWTTAKYHIIETNYYKITDSMIIERSDEWGSLPIKQIPLGRFLDKVFYSADVLEEATT